MATTNVTIRMDAKLKKQAEELFADLGMNITTAFTIFAKQAVREQQLPFVITRVQSATAEDTKSNINLNRAFSLVPEYMDSMDIDDN